tara:strand:- start:386 stop:976 length:591 start_codon:yes stop_codon:yes gene_type:complete
VGNTINIKGKEYTKVVNRLKDFRDTFPANEGWAIKTEPISITNESVVFQATINNPDGATVAVGHGHNILGADKALEKAETVAIGRAIGNFHPVYGGESDEFASAEEMQKWQENNNRSLKSIKSINVDNEVLGGGNEQPQETNGELIWNFSGKNKGKKVSELDPNTCVWYLDNLDHLDAPENAHYKKALQAVVNGSS